LPSPSLADKWSPPVSSSSYLQPSHPIAMAGCTGSLPSPLLFSSLCRERHSMRVAALTAPPHLFLSRNALHSHHRLRALMAATAGAPPRPASRPLPFPSAL
jgi:hypothetical protein